MCDTCLILKGIFVTLRLFVLTLASVLTTGAVSLAAAQDAVGDDPLAITSAEVPLASGETPDWYQRFSTSDSTGGYNAWTGHTETDVQFNLAPSARWNVQVELTSREGQNITLPRDEVWAGATYNITSRLSIGGSLGVGTEDLGIGSQWREQKVETGIRLQSAFKF